MRSRVAAWTPIQCTTTTQKKSHLAYGKHVSLQEDSEGKSNANCENNPRYGSFFDSSQEKNDDDCVLQDEDGVEDELSPKRVKAFIPVVVKGNKIVNVDVAEPVDKTIVQNLQNMRKGCCGFSNDISLIREDQM